MLRILLVDDNPDDRLLIIRALKKEFEDVDVIQVLDRKDFKKNLDDMKFDLVITDYQLRWADGLEVLKEIKKKDKFMPVIMFTATGNEEIAVEAMKNGLDDYVLKSAKHFIKLPVAIKSVLEKNREKKKALEAELRYKRLFDNLPVGVYISDYEGNILEFNPAAMKMFGYKEEDLRKGLKADVLYVSSDDRKKLIESLERNDIINDYEVELKRKDKRKFWASINARAIRDEKGKVKYIEGIIIDVTREKALQQQLIQAQKMEAIGRLTGSIAHDFNNMLTPIMGFADLIIAKFNPDPTQKIYLEEIKKAAQRAALLTKQLLAFSRRQYLNPEVLDLNEAISEIKEMLNRLLGEDIQLVFDFEKELWPCKADKTQIQQVILNLAVNARDAMPDGGKLKIKTENIYIGEEYTELHPDAKEGEYVLVTVEDTGVGIDKEIIDYIFEPFFTTKPEGEGTGLGLSVVYGIIKQHGGWINVYSEKGEGTSFKIYLPATPVGKRTSELRPERHIEIDGKGRKVLVVEDEEGVRKFLSMVLNKHHFLPVEAENIEEAIKIFEKEEIDVLICDLILPDGSGIEIAESFTSKKPDLRVIISSGYSDKERELSMIREKEWYFLPKPYTLQKLIEVLKEIFKG